MKRRSTKQKTRPTKKQKLSIASPSPSPQPIASPKFSAYQNSAYFIEAYHISDTNHEFPGEVTITSSPILEYDEKRFEYNITVQSQAIITWTRKWKDSAFTIILSKPDTYTMNNWRFMISDTTSKDVFCVRVRPIHSKNGWQEILPSLPSDVISKIVAPYVHEKDLFELWSFPCENLKWLLATREKNAQVAAKVDTSLIDCPFFQENTIGLMMQACARKTFNELVDLKTCNENGDIVSCTNIMISWQNSEYPNEQRLQVEKNLVFAFVKQVCTDDGTVLPMNVHLGELIVIPGGKYIMQCRSTSIDGNDNLKTINLTYFAIQWVDEEGLMMMKFYDY